MKYLGQYNVTKNKETVILTDEGEYPIWVKDAEKYFVSLEKGEEIESTPHAGMLFYLKMPFDVKKGDIIRGK